MSADQRKRRTLQIAGREIALILGLGALVLVVLGLVVGVANTGYVGGRRCIDSACEEDRRGRVVMRKGMNYGQQTWWLTTCVGADRRFSLETAGCRLAQPRA